MERQRTTKEFNPKMDTDLVASADMTLASGIAATWMLGTSRLRTFCASQ
jgi:hypothetical protein